MFQDTFLSGTEIRSIEVMGHLPMGRAHFFSGELSPIALTDGQAELNLLAFRMESLAPKGFHWLGANYGEVLLRLGVTFQNAPAWLAIHCYLDEPKVAAMGRRLIRYPTTCVSLIELAAENGATHLRAKTTKQSDPALWMALETRSHSAPEPAPVRPTLVRERNHLYRIPWNETPAPKRWSAAPIAENVSLIEKMLGAKPVWTDALVHEGRIHHCGIATSVEKRAI